MKKYILVIIFIIGGAGVMFAYHYKKTNPPSPILTPVGQTQEFSNSYVNIGSTRIAVEIATSTAVQEKGLSGRPSLPPSSGMLFVFSEPKIRSFWMPDMRFPLDIVWINNNKVVDITANVSDDFNPENPILYTPSSPAQYVLEVNAGFAAHQHIKIGDSVSLQNI